MNFIQIKMNQGMIIFILNIFIILRYLFSFSSKTITKSGGRVFDISVDIVDPIAGAMISEINHIAALEMKIEPLLSEVNLFLNKNFICLTEL